MDDEERRADKHSVNRRVDSRSTDPLPGLIGFRRDPVNEDLVISEGTREVYRFNADDTLRLYAWLGYSFSRRYKLSGMEESKTQSAAEIPAATPSRERDAILGAGTGDERLPSGGTIHAKGGTTASTEVVGANMGTDREGVGDQPPISVSPGKQSAQKSWVGAPHPFYPSWHAGAEGESCIRCGLPKKIHE